jgi:hypothetical protein
MCQDLSKSNSVDSCLQMCTGNTASLPMAHCFNLPAPNLQATRPLEMILWCDTILPREQQQQEPAVWRRANNPPQEEKA